MPRMTCFACVRMRSRNGTAATDWVACTFLNAGVSMIFRRMYTPMTTSSSETRNATRHQPWMNMSPGNCVSNATIPVASASPADTEPLADTQYQQQDRRPHADRVIGRQQADQERADPHDQQREDQHLLAPEAIAEVAEDDPRDRTRDEADQRRPEREHGADQRIERGEEQLVEDQRGEGVVEKEVIPLDGGADGARQRNL